MIYKSAKDRWARKAQTQVLNIANETDSCAAINGAHMTPADRQEVRRLGEKIVEILSKY